MADSRSEDGGREPGTRRWRTLVLQPYAHQVEAFNRPQRNLVVVKGRRAGGTQGAVLRLIELAHRGKVPSRHLWVDTVQRNIAKLVARMFTPLLWGTQFRWNAGLQVLHFEGGSTCDFGSAERPERLEGFGYDGVWVNEAGIVLRDEALYHHTLLPMLLESRRAQMVFVGAPKGSGLFQRMYEWGQDPAREDWASVRQSSWLNPKLDAGVLLHLREQLPERAFRQEVLAEFVADEGEVFPDPAPVLTEEPPPAPPGARYVMGVDLARLQDYTVAWVGCVETASAVHCERFARLPWRQQVHRLVALSQRFGQARLVVDATGVGDPVCEELSAAGLAVERIVFTAQRKQKLLEALALALEQQRISLLRHDRTLAELRQFRYGRGPSGQLTLSPPPGEHDDCVIALALCHWGITRLHGGHFILGPSLSALQPDW